MARALAPLACLTGLVTATPAWPQTGSSGITLTRSTPISSGGSPHVESYIAADPSDARHLIATAMTISAPPRAPAVWTSFDAGATWLRGRFVDSADVIADADPIVAITRSGAALFATLARVNGEDQTAVARTTDGGRTWRWAAILPSSDREWMVVDRGAGPFSGRVYLATTGSYRTPEGRSATAPLIARSDDQGQTFPMRSLVTHDRGGLHPLAPINAVPLEPMVAGGLFVLALQGADTAELTRLARDSLTARTLGVAVSEDGGESFGAVRYAPRSHVVLTGSTRRRLRAWAAHGNVRTAIDASPGLYRHRIYFVAADYDRALDRFVVRLWFTPDFGKTWGTTTVSDAPRGDVANPAIAVNHDGVVAVTWNDRRDDPGGTCWHLYAAISADGGEHFLPSARLSQTLTCVADPRNWVTFGTALSGEDRGEFLARIQTGATIPWRFPNGGDTQGLAADGAGAFHAAWIAGEAGPMQVWYTGFTVDPAEVARVRRATSPIARAPVTTGRPGEIEVTRDVTFNVVHTKLDFASRRYAIVVVIENKSNRPLSAPLRAEMRRFLDPARHNGLGLRNLAAANADNGERGIGATWLFSTDEATLGPGARTKPRTLEFTFEGGVPEFPEGYLYPGFRIYGPATPR